MHRILIVDDDLDILSLVKVSLSMNNYIVEGLSMWEKIDDCISKFVPDLVLLDISLHGADGRDICKRIHEAPATAHIPVVLFSANADMGRNYSDYGAVAFIEKPYELSHMLRTIESFL